MTEGATLLAIILAVVSAIGAPAQSHADAAKLTNPVAASAESVAAGKQIYQRNCASCHGASGQGGPGNDLIPAAPSLVSGKWAHGASDGEIFDNVKNGVGPDFNMVPFKDSLKDDDIWNVVNFIRSIARK
jgi:mono/diheme cytochrome c family protein